MEKYEFVKSLKNVKVVIGNGFDLHCGLYTKYSDFYCKNYKTYVFIQKLYNEYVADNNYEINFNDETINTLNVWDIFFALNSPDNPKECKRNWCDIELLLKESFKDTNNLSPKISLINWPEVKRLFEAGHVEGREREGFILKFILNKIESGLVGVDSFYHFLLNELKIFEKSFGKFIYWQLHYGKTEEIYFRCINLNKSYINRAKYVLDYLCDAINATVDSFNYSFIEDEIWNKKINYINGNFKSPIFGIDTCFEPNDERYIFTKTSRRIEDEINNFDYTSREEIENVVIFGHSLNEADYNYFFPLFDRLNLVDSTKSGTVVFAYYVYDKNNEDKIKQNLRIAISKMIYEYAKEKRVSNPHRFLDALSANRRVLTYQIPGFDYTLIYETGLDKEWKPIFKEIDNIK